MITIWQTQHDISREVTNRLAKTLSQAFNVTIRQPGEHFKSTPVNIGYGILRGIAEVQKMFNDYKAPFIYIDKGYTENEHFDGNYRFCLNEPQNHYTQLIQPDEIITKPFQTYRNGFCLICPPTQHMVSYHGIDLAAWHDAALKRCAELSLRPIVREKGDSRPLQGMLDACTLVYTFNSSVAWHGALKEKPVIMTHPRALLHNANLASTTIKKIIDLNQAKLNDLNKITRLIKHFVKSIDT